MDKYTESASGWLHHHWLCEAPQRLDAHLFRSDAATWEYSLVTSQIVMTFFWRFY